MLKIYYLNRRLWLVRSVTISYHLSLSLSLSLWLFLTQQVRPFVRPSVRPYPPLVRVPPLITLSFVSLSHLCVSLLRPLFEIRSYPYYVCKLVKLLYADLNL